MPLPLRAISVFHEVAKVGSISRAAETLGVTPSAVTQQIQLLEGQVGVSLTAKAGRYITLTEAGERYFASITDGIEQIAEATEHLRGAKSIMALRVRATPTLSNKWLLPRLASFLDHCADIELRLDGTNEPTDFEREAIDVEIRHGDGRWPGLFVEALVEENFLPVAAPALAAAASLEPAELTRHRLIHSVKAQAQWSQWFALSGVVPATRWRKVMFDRSHMAIDAAVGGLGIALESTLMTERERAAGLLVCPVRAPPEIRIVTQWIVCPRDHLRHKKVRLFLEWLRQERDRWTASQAIVGPAAADCVIDPPGPRRKRERPHARPPALQAPNASDATR
ncbi:LysR substrate-binding domain-containing protein [Lichenicoccus sp.]|uniref:LysR substrate-binding domain-containing protein n=1 Tax=Lichenicoccus sp. TaxID=2781899 RepID=UPI003D1201EF